MKNLLSVLILGVVLAGCSADEATSSCQPCAMGRGMKPMPPSVEEVFEKDDLNTDGKISKEEFLKHQEQRAARPMKKHKKRGNPEDMFKKMDSNSDGFITKEEMEKHRESFPMKSGKGRR